MGENDNMDYFYQQVLQKDVSRRLQVGPDLVDYLSDPQRSSDVEQDKPRLDKTIDELTGWVNSSNFKVWITFLKTYWFKLIIQRVHSVESYFIHYFFTLAINEASLFLVIMFPAVYTDICTHTTLV